VSDESRCVIDSVTGEVEHLTPSKGSYNAPLTTKLQIHREMGKVFREARSGKLEIQQCSKLMYCLGIISKSATELENSDLQARLEILEDSLNGN